MKGIWMRQNVLEFGSGYKLFSMPWWRHFLRPSTYYMPFIHSYQRITRGWADCDTWSIDWWMSDIAADSIEYLKKVKHGIPCNLTEEEWDKILSEIIDGFRAYHRSDNIPEEFVKELDTSTGIFADLGFKDRKYDWDAIKKYQESEYAKFKHALDLLKDWYPSLWD